jgi:hypothetical protein
VNKLDGGVTLIDHLGCTRLVRADGSPALRCTDQLSVKHLERGHANRGMIVTIVRELC